MVCVITWANSEEDITRLIDALAGISAAEGGKTTGRTGYRKASAVPQPAGDGKDTAQRHILRRERKPFPFAEAEGRIA